MFFAINLSQLFAQAGMYYGDIINIPASDSIQTQVMAARKSIEVLGWLGNDLITASDVFNMNGYISDDVLSIGNQLYVRGTIADMFAAAGETIVIDGNILGDVFVAGATIRITENADIHGNVYMAGQQIVFEGGNIEGNLTIAGNQLDLNGIVRKKTELYSYKVNFGPGYHSELGTNIYSNRPVYHKNIRNVPENLYISIEEPNIVRLLLFKGGIYLSLFVTGLILIGLFRKSSTDIYRFSIEHFWTNTGIGFITFIVYPIVLFVLVGLVVTIPLSLFLFFLYGMLLLIGYLLVALVLGVSSLRFFKFKLNDSSYYWGLLIGMILVAIIVNLPFLGWLFHAIFILFGLGSLTYYIWEMRTLYQTPDAVKT